MVIDSRLVRPPTERLRRCEHQQRAHNRAAELTVVCMQWNSCSAATLHWFDEDMSLVVAQQLSMDANCTAHMLTGGSAQGANGSGRSWLSSGSNDLLFRGRTLSFSMYIVASSLHSRGESRGRELKTPACGLREMSDELKQAQAQALVDPRPVTWKRFLPRLQRRRRMHCPLSTNLSGRRPPSPRP